MRALGAAAALLGLSLAAAPAGADGQPGSVGLTPPAPQVSPAPKVQPAPAAPMILNMLNRPVESQEAAFRESIRQAARAPEAGPGDGTIRIGGATLTIVVKDPCPDGEPFHDVAPLVQRPRPGRTRR
jgi:hypothetical protein